MSNCKVTNTGPGAEGTSPSVLSTSPPTPTSLADTPDCMAALPLTAVNGAQDLSVVSGPTMSEADTPDCMAALPLTAVNGAQDLSVVSGPAMSEANNCNEPVEECKSMPVTPTLGAAAADPVAGNSVERDMVAASSENPRDCTDEQDTGTEAAPSTSVTPPSPGSELVPEHPGWDFWRGALGGARLVVAPMVDASELAWRLLSRRYGAELCYTPMLHSVVLVRDPRYRKANLQTCPQDRPLLVQVCANDPTVLGEACHLVSPNCDGVDINLGCPQAIARKGRYGAFLMNDWGLIERLVRSAVASSSVPVTCKIRVYPSHAKTVQYALMLQRAGASLLTVHGRTIDQKGPQTGLADWSYVKAVRNAVKVPVFANGNIQYRRDVERCLQATGAQGVMSAEGNLHNPALFADPAHYGPDSTLFAYSAPYVKKNDSGPDPAPTVWHMALEYLDLVLQYPCPISYTRGHLFKLLQHCFSLAEHSDIRQCVSRSNSVLEMRASVEQLRERMEPYARRQQPWVSEAAGLGALPLPPWLCQPYVRIPPDVHAKRCEEGQRRAQDQRDQKLADRLRELPSLNGCEAADCVASASLKRPLEGGDGKEVDLLLLTGETTHLSKKKAKQLLRNPRKKFPRRVIENIDLCVCRSLRGSKCDHLLCKACCKSRCYREDLDCKGHRIWVRTSRLEATTLPPKPAQAQSVETSHTSVETITAVSECPDQNKTSDEMMDDSMLNETEDGVVRQLATSNVSVDSPFTDGNTTSASQHENCSEIASVEKVAADQAEPFVR